MFVSPAVWRRIRWRMANSPGIPGFEIIFTFRLQSHDAGNFNGFLALYVYNQVLKTASSVAGLLRHLPVAGSPTEEIEILPDLAWN